MTWRLALALATILIIPMLGASGAVSGFAAKGQGGQAIAMLQNQAGEVVGTVVFSEDDRHVSVQADAWDLPPGYHGFHVHAIGVCDAAMQFTSAGGHFDAPMSGIVGGMHGHHAADMPSLYVNADGTASLAFAFDRFTVADLLADGGRAIIVHADPDNFAHIPSRYGTPDQMTLDTGDAGGRIACGVIQ